MDGWFENVATIPIDKFGNTLVYWNGNLQQYLYDEPEDYDRDSHTIKRPAFYASIFSVLCVDEPNDRLAVTKQSATRAFNAFQIDNRSIFNAYMNQLLRDKDSVM